MGKLQHYEAIHSSRNLKTTRCTIGIHTGSFSLGVSLKTMQKIQKELDGPNVYNESMATWTLHSDHSSKRNPGFVAEIQTMTDNNPSKSVKPIAWDMVETEFFGGFLSSRTYMNTFSISHTKWKKSIFISGHERQVERHCCKAFDQLMYLLQPNMLWFFSEEEKICQDQIVNSYNIGFLCPHKTYQ